MEESTIRSYIDLKPGEELSLDTIDGDIKRLYSSGLIEDVKVEKTPVPGEPDQVIVTYVITEKWMVNSVKFEGNHKINKDDLKTMVNIPERSIFNPVKLSEAVAKIRREYEAKGMFLTQVRPSIEELKEGVVDIVFEIEEHPKPLVAKVRFYGNEKFKSRKLRKIMITKQEWYLFTASKFQEELLNEDFYRIYEFYLDNGFLDSKIQPPQAYLDIDQERVYVTTFLEEGDQYRVAQVRIQGDLVAPEEKLRQGLVTNEGEIYSESRVRRDIQYLTDYYSNLGYHLVQVDREVKTEKELRLAYLKFNIRKGPKIYLERIEIRGNTRTFDPVIRRELAVKEGYLYSDAQARRSKSRLMRLGYFDSVDSFDRPGTEPDRMTMELAVKEGKSGTLMAGAGYSSLEQFFANVQYQQRNFLGRGWDINTNFRASTSSTDFSVNFSDPYFLGSEYHLGLSGYSYSTAYVSFDETRRGASATTGRKIPHTEYSYAYLTYKWDLASLEHFSESAHIYHNQPKDLLTSSLTFSWKRNALNNYMDPSQGMYSVSSLEYAGGALGSDSDFTKWLGEVRYYHPLPIKRLGHYFGLKAKAGYLWYPDTDRLLVSERFFLGGPGSLRGYNAGTISPFFIESDGYKSRIGGNKMALFSGDYIIPLGSSGFKLSLFYDAGNAYNDNEPFDLGRLRQDWGVGILWASPMGPLKFELGFPINRQKDEDASVFNFGMGSAY